MRWLAPIAAVAFALAIGFSTMPAYVLIVTIGWVGFSAFVLFRIQSHYEKRRQRAEDPTHCFHCGYDLRATPDRCPECGAEPPTSPEFRRHG